ETDDGRLFLVMECVDGEPIDRYCDRRRLSIDRRLTLFVEMCRAVESAHRALVVHRDLKPTNVVVTAEGTVKLLDFGIARALEPDGEARATRTMTRIMTPAYASPEQVRGQQITTATDVYQLGLLLYLLLTGERAQHTESLSPAAFEHAVCELSPPRPSDVVKTGDEAVARARSLALALLATRLRGDLDAIVAQAMRKEPERRYESVAHLSEDIERHRQGLPVRARPNSLGYRLGRWVVRRRRTLVWLTLGLAILSASVAVMLEARFRAARDAQRADQIVTVIESLFVYPRASGTREPAGMSDFAEDALGLIRRELHDQPERRARLLARLGRTFSSIGEYARAADLFDEALGVLDADDERTRADLLYQRGRNQHYSGALAAAEQSFLDVEQRLAAIYGARHERTLGVVVERSDLLHSLGRLREAQEALEPVVTALQTSETDRGRVRELRAHAQGVLGNVLRDRGLHERAETAYRNALRRIEWLAPRGTRAASHSIHYARLLTLRGRFDAAERRLLGELEVLREVHHGEHPLIAVAYRELAFTAMQRGRLDPSRAHLTRAIESTGAWLDGSHPTVPRILAIAAELERRRGRPDDAITLAQEALGLFDALGLTGHPSALDACLTLGDAAREQDRALPAPTLDELAGCLEAAERELIDNDPRTLALRISMRGSSSG
ncbi:MAG: serine/threonine-protein kinase, partial [Acidobacteriota bacterium]